MSLASALSIGDGSSDIYLAGLAHLTTAHIASEDSASARLTLAQ